MRLRIPVVEISAAVICAAVLTYFLLLPPIIGLADNGDFSRIMVTTGLSYTDGVKAEDNYFGYVNRQYELNGNAKHTLGYFTSQILLVELSKLADRIVSGNDNIYDIRFLSLLYIILITASIFLLVKYAAPEGIVPKSLFAAAAVFIFTDAGYACYLNSLYGEAVSYSFLLLTAGAALLLCGRDRPGVPALALFFLAASALAASKAQNAPIGIILALFMLRCVRLRGDLRWKRLAAVFSAAIFMVAAVSYLSIPDWIKTCNKYHTVFYGILKDSPDPRRDLQELGLDPALLPLAGTTFFDREHPISINDPEVIGKINGGISHLKTALFYAGHPSRFLRKLRVTAENAFTIMPGYGNYEKSPGTAFGKSAYPLSLWGRFKKERLPNTLSAVSLLFFTYYALTVKGLSRCKTTRERLRHEFMLLFGAAGALLFIVPILGDGEADLAKHLFLFNAAFDMMLAATLAYAGGFAAGIIRKARAQ